MDPTTEYILQRTRERKVQLDEEYATISTNTPTKTTSPSSTSTANDFMMTLEDSSLTKKRKSMGQSRDENDDGNLTSDHASMPSKKSSFKEHVAIGEDAPMKPPRSFYPVAQLEEMAKAIDYESDPAALTPASQMSSTTQKSTASSLKSALDKLADDTTNFDFQARPKHVTFSSGRPDQLPSRTPQTSNVRSPIAIRYGRKVEEAPSKPVDQQVRDSGIESFYRQRSVEEKRTPEAISENGGQNSFIPKPVQHPSVAATSKTTSINDPPQKLGGLTTLLGTDRSGTAAINRPVTPKPAGKVASLAGAWENQIRGASDVSPAPKPIAKVAAASVSREREIPKPTASGSVFGQITTTASKKVQSGVDSRPRKAVNIIINRFEAGRTQNPDDSLVDDPMTESATRMVQPFSRPHHQQPVVSLASVVSASVKEKTPPRSVIPKPPKSPESPIQPTVDAYGRDQVEPYQSPSEIRSPKAFDSSHDSSALSDYLNEAISCAQAAATTPTKPATQFPIDVEPRTSATISDHMEPVRPVALVHTVSIYRKMINTEQASSRPSSVVVMPPMSPAAQYSSPGVSRVRGGSATGAKFSSMESDTKMKALMDKIAEKNTQISQLSRALSLCKDDNGFRGSIEEVEIQKNLLICKEHRRCLIEERTRLEECYRNRVPFSPASPHGTVTIKSITLPLQRAFFSQMTNLPTLEICYFICILKYRDTFHVTQMISSDEVNNAGDLVFTNYFQFSQLPPDFAISLDVYVLRTMREHLTHAEKYRLDGSSKSGTLTKQRTLRGLGLGLFSSGSTSQASSLSGPDAVADIKFTNGGHMTIELGSVGKRRFSLNETQYGFPLEGGIQLELRCVADSIGIEPECGFLNCYEDINGTIAWKRMWVVLDGDYLKFWRYPEDESEGKHAVFQIDLKSITSASVGQASIEITSRPNSFAFDTSEGYSVILSADTKDERKQWCAKLNDFLKHVRMWTVPGGRHH